MGCTSRSSRGCARSCSKMVGLSGLEPLTSRLSGVCSNHLSYKPVPHLGGILLRFRLYALVKDSHLAVATTPKGLWQRNSSREEKGYHFLFGSWRFQMDRKPVDLV